MSFTQLHIILFATQIHLESKPKLALERKKNSKMSNSQTIKLTLLANYPRGTVPSHQRVHRPPAAISASPRSILPLRGNAPPSARAPRAALPSLFAFLMSLSLSALIRPSMRLIQLALYRQAAPGRPLLPFGGSGFTVSSPMRLSALANREPCSVSPSASYASDNPSASSLSFSTQIQLNR